MSGCRCIYDHKPKWEAHKKFVCPKCGRIWRGISNGPKGRGWYLEQEPNHGKAEVSK